jgi:hypothetical protein
MRVMERPLSEPGQDVWLRRQALQIACQLPESEADALKVLEYARELVSGFMSED